jgi:hypothetical protein
MRHEFKGLGIYISACEVNIYKTPTGRYIVQLTDIGEGTSVTNAAERIATEIYNLFLKAKGIQLEDIVWVEHYPDSDVAYSVINLVDLQATHAPAGYNSIDSAYMRERYPAGTIYLGLNHENGNGWTHLPETMFDDMRQGADDITEEL